MKKNSEKVYVKVTSEFDSTGYMQPTSITWSDGRTFSIEQVRDRNCGFPRRLLHSPDQWPGKASVF